MCSKGQHKDGPTALLYDFHGAKLVKLVKILDVGNYLNVGKFSVARAIQSGLKFCIFVWIILNI